MAPTSTAAAKRKKPPTFQHLPTNRAKKLKKSWVEVQKIKSKWKAQKRKEGLAPSHPAVTAQEPAEGDDERASTEEDADMEEPGGVESERETATADESSESESPEEEEIAVSPQARPTKKRRTEKSNTRTKPTDRDIDEKKAPSLRELHNMAYSKSSLHTYKSHPLRRGHANSGPSRGRDGGRGRGSGRGRGNGQPDMRLRMNAMLEKIKRDFA